MTRFSEYFPIAHICLDLVVLVLLVWLIKRGQKKQNEEVDLAITKELEKIVKETREIGAQFETALSERRVIINNLLKKIDERIERGKTLIEELTRAQKEHLFQKNGLNLPSNRLISQILTHFDRGLSVDEICEKCGKTRGEVELILKLYSESRVHLSGR